MKFFTIIVCLLTLTACLSTNELDLGEQKNTGSEKIFISAGKTVIVQEEEKLKVPLISQTPIKDFIREYLIGAAETKISQHGMHPSYDTQNYQIRLNKRNNFANIVLDMSDDYGNPFWLVAESDAITFEMKRQDESMIRKLEEILQEKFGIENITFSYHIRDEKQPIKIYENHKYIYDDFIYGMSDDGRYVNMFDMVTGRDLREDFIDEKYNGKCGVPANSYFFDSTVSEYCNDLLEKTQKKYGMNTDFDISLSFFSNTVMVDDDIYVYGKIIDSGEEEKNLQYDYTNKININYSHEGTGVEVTIMTIDNMDCKLTPYGFYGHEKMQGLYFIFVDSGCFWENMNITVLSQSLLDTKLARLYNNVAMVYYGDRKYSLALKYLRKAVEKDPKYAQAWYSKASIESLQNRQGEAFISLKKSGEFGGEIFFEKAKTDMDFENIRESREFREIIGNSDN